MTDLAPDASADPATSPATAPPDTGPPTTAPEPAVAPQAPAGPLEDPNATPVAAAIPAASALEPTVEHDQGTGTDLLHYTGDQLDAGIVTGLARAAGYDVIGAPDLIREWVDDTGRHYHWRIQVSATPTFDPKGA